MVDMCKGLSAYEKSCRIATQVLQSYNGNRDVAVLSMNAVFDAVKEGRRYLDRKGHRFINDYGVGIVELRDGAEAGVGLVEDLGQEKGMKALYDLGVALVKSDLTITKENLGNLLKVIEMEAQR